ncbi:hypothetical protein [Corynebacterium glyciniphilum]|nr:hypothetical protein [Corynebacterium glyciniphilum]
MSKKNSRNQQRAAAKKKRRATRVKKRAVQTSQSMLDDDFGTMYLPEFAFDEPAEPNVLPMWEYDDPECLELIKQEHPDSSDEQILDAMFAEPVRAQTPGGYVYSLPTHAVLGMSEGSTGVQLFAAAKRRFRDGKISWDKDGLVHIAPDITPDPDEAFYR